MLFISLGFLINEDTLPNELKTLSGKLESNIFDQVNIILNTTDKETIQRTRELMNQIYIELAAIDEKIKSMVKSIDVAPATNKFYVGDTIKQESYKLNIKGGISTRIPISYEYIITAVDLAKKEYSAKGNDKTPTFTFEDAHKFYHKV